MPVIALTSEVATARRLCLHWGTSCHIVGPVDRFKTAVIAAVRATLAEGLADPSDFIVVTAGVPFNTPGSTNIVRVAPCDEKLIYPSDPE